MPKAKKAPQNVISIDGSDYEFDKLADEAKIAISHISQLETEINNLQMRMAQLDAAKSTFINRLKYALPDNVS